MSNVYEKLGFKYLNTTEPNYFYFKNLKLYSRVQFQKHKLKRFNNYSDDKTELQIVIENGYRRIYDAGNIVYGIIQ